jgi:hypothetical protein
VQQAVWGSLPTALVGHRDANPGCAADAPKGDASKAEAKKANNPRNPPSPRRKRKPLKRKLLKRSKSALTLEKAGSHPAFFI